MVIEYTLHSNGWTVFLKNFNFAQASLEDLRYISDLLKTNPLIIARKQLLSIEDEVSLLKMFPSPGPYPINGDFMVNGSRGMLIKVTKHGLFGEPEGLPWHCDNPGQKENREISYLYSIKGSLGSITTFNNSNLALKDWDGKESLKDIKCLTQHGDTVSIITKYGLFFPAHQILEIKNNNSLIDDLGEFILQDQYCYHHEWQDQDIILSNQMISLHKRWPFNGMSDRLLHKAAMGFIPQKY